MGCWERLICMHGKQEGLDSHDCMECQEIAKKCGYDQSKGQTYIFTSQRQANEALKETKLKK